MAAPQVAAAGALVRHLNPDLGWGILAAGSAVSAARRIDAPAPVGTISAARTTRAGHVTLRLHGTDTGPPGVVVSGVRKFRIYRSTDGRPRVKIAVTSRDR